MTKNLVVVDLDGTLCDSAHRDHLARAGEWNEFHGALMNDEPHEAVARLVAILAGSEQELIVLGLTGRNERYRMATNNWLAAHDIVLDDLLMRPDNDFTSDHELKPQMLEAWCQDEWGRAALDSVLFILEDRDKVVEAWRNLGFICWQTQPGGY